MIFSKVFFSSATLILPVTTSKHSPPALLLNSEGCLPALEAPPVEQLPALLVSCWRCDVGSSSRRFLSWSLLLHNCCRLASVFLMSNVSSNSPLLQKCSFFKCAPPGTRLFLPMRQCILAEWRFFKCAPSSKVLSSNAFLLQMHSTRHRGQLTHWSWQCRLHYHGPRNSGRKWLQPLEL